MQDISQILLLQRAYAIASIKLAHIGNHPIHVEMGHIGYLMDIESIKELVQSFDPTDWYKEEVFNGKNVTFDDLPQQDRWDVQEALTDMLSASVSEKHLIEKCNKCGGLSSRFANSILELKIQKDKFKKSMN